MPFVYYDGNGPVMYVVSHRITKFVYWTIFEDAIRDAVKKTQFGLFQRLFFRKHIEKLMDTFHQLIKPKFCDFILSHKLMIDAGAVYESFITEANENLRLALPATAKEMNNIGDWLNDEFIITCMPLSWTIQSLPEMATEWEERRGSDVVNSMLAKYNGTFEVDRSSWPAKIITICAVDEWDRCYSMVEHAREWWLSGKDRREAKQFDSETLKSALMVDVLTLDFRWLDDKLSVDCIAKDFGTGMQCRTGLVCGSPEDVKILLFSQDIIPILLFKGLRKDV